MDEKGEQGQIGDGLPNVGDERADALKVALWRAFQDVTDGMVRERDGSDPRSHLTHDQLSALKGLIAGDSVEFVAADLRVHPERLRRWRQTPRFQRAEICERARPMTLSQHFGNWDETKKEAG